MTPVKTPLSQLTGIFYDEALELSEGDFTKFLEELKKTKGRVIMTYTCKHTFKIPEKHKKLIEESRPKFLHKIDKKFFLKKYPWVKDAA